jgi:transketolase
VSERRATREALGETLVQLAAEGREDIVVLDADLAKATTTVKFKAAYPERFFDVGIAEQNLIGTAARPA